MLDKLLEVDVRTEHCVLLALIVYAYQYSQEKTLPKIWNFVLSIENIHDLNFSTPFNQCTNFLMKIKKTLPPEVRNKLYAFRTTADAPIDCAVMNLDRENINTDRHAIVISHKLLTLLNEQERQAVLAQKIAHITLNHITFEKIFLTKGCHISFQLGEMAVILLVVKLMKWKPFGHQDHIELTKILFLLFTMLMLNHYTKTKCQNIEFSADKESLIYTRNKQSLISALKKIEKANNKNQDQVSKHSSDTATVFYGTNCLNDLFAAHPSIKARIKKIEKLEIPDERTLYFQV